MNRQQLGFSSCESTKSLLQYCGNINERILAKVDTDLKNQPANCNGHYGIKQPYITQKESLVTGAEYINKPKIETRKKSIGNHLSFMN